MVPPPPPLSSNLFHFDHYRNRTSNIPQSTSGTSSLLSGHSASPEDESQNILNCLQNKVFDDGMHLRWLARISELNDILDSELFRLPDRDMPSSHQQQEVEDKLKGAPSKGSESASQSPNPATVMDEHTSPSQSKDKEPTVVASVEVVEKMEELIKPHMLRLVEDICATKMWITLLIPAVEDGNNFNVAIQEAFLVDLRSYESCLFEYFDHIYGYYFARAKAMKNVIKYPQLKDFKRIVQKYDERQANLLRYFGLQIRDIYMCMYDHMMKNIDRLKQPKTREDRYSLY